MTTKDAREAILEIQVNAALAGHDLEPFEPGDTIEGAGYQAKCRQCNETDWVGNNGLMYSLLNDTCPELNIPNEIT